MLEPQGQCNCQGCGGLIWQSTYSARYMAQRKDPHLFDAIVPWTLLQAMVNSRSRCPGSSCDSRSKIWTAPTKANIATARPHMRPAEVKWRVVAYQQFALMCFLFGKLPLMQVLCRLS